LADLDQGKIAAVKSSSRSRQALTSRSAFVGFRFPAEVIVVAVRWYLRYGLSDRDVEDLLAERGRAGRSRQRLPVGAAVHAAASGCGPLRTARAR
jgi:hypothetical protein